MNSIEALLGLNKSKETIAKPAIQPAPEPPAKLAEEKPKKAFSLNLGSKKPDDKIAEVIKEDTSSDKNRVADILDQSSDPFAGLSTALDNLSLEPSEKQIEEKEDTSFLNESKDPNSQFENPTLADVSKFVFDEQPDETDEVITHQFSKMLDELQEATGDLIPEVLANNLKFIKAHPFLAEILKPSSISILASSMRKSYGYIVVAKTEKAAKKAKTNAKVSAVLDSLGGFNF